MKRRTDMAETTKQITFEEKSDRTTGRTTYRIKRLFNMHSVGLKIGATYDPNGFRDKFVTSKNLQGVDIILE